jgi:ABC-2 type transport system permease protein
MKEILNVAIKELTHLRRDKRVFPILFIAPVIQIILLGLAATMDVKKTPYAIIRGDGKNDPFFIERKLSGEYFTFMGEIPSLDDALKLMRMGKIEVAIYNADPLMVLVDGSNANSARIISSYITSSLSDFYSKCVNFAIKVLYNEKLSSRNFMVPGVLATILLVITLALTAVSLVREKEMGTIEQVITTPLKRKNFLIGKLLPYILIGIIDSGIIVSVGIFVLSVPFRGSFFLLFFFCFLFVINTVGFGIFFSVISRTQQQAMVSIFMLILPLIILSGFIFPVENMPFIFQVLSRVDPFTHFLKAVRFIFLRGSGINELYPEAISLFLIGAIILSFSVLLFRKSLE